MDKLGHKCERMMAFIVKKSRKCLTIDRATNSDWMTMNC